MDITDFPKNTGIFSKKQEFPKTQEFSKTHNRFSKTQEFSKKHNLSRVIYPPKRILPDPKGAFV